MLLYPNPNPVAFHIGTWPVYWYGLMYLFGFLIAWALLSLRVRHSTRVTQEQLSDLLFYSALGIIIGGRLGYVLFYDWSTFFHHPLMVFQTWKGGMSFHGGLLGVILVLFWQARKDRRPLFELTDLVAPVVPVGLGLGRIGNFINDELWGRVTDVPWAMSFPNAGPELRHPSQLYECGLEGVTLFVLLWLYSSKPRPAGAVSGLFLLGYGLMRFFVEFFRAPDAQIGYLWAGATEGQMLSLPMIVLGVALLLWAYRKGVKA
jgi:phosphatidylglycerol:prolipoprotein diacylglycerol transferase